jgi:hypothetical protein
VLEGERDLKEEIHLIASRVIHMISVPSFNDYRLLDMPNVVATPHIVLFKKRRWIMQTTAQSIVDYSAGTLLIS